MTEIPIYQAVLFDLDGVVIDTHQAVTDFWLNLAVKHGVQLTPADFQQHIYGCPVDHTLDWLFPGLEQPARQAVSSTLQEYEVEQTYRAVPGVISLLQALKQWSVPTALVTSAESWKVDTVAGQLELEGLFATRVLISDIRQGKPHPEGYLLAAQRLQKAPQQCIVFEDAVSGVTAAVAAGAVCVGVKAPEGGSALIEAGAYCTMPDFTQVKMGPVDGNSGDPAGRLYLQLDPDTGFNLVTA
jgi:HAD superfamily hydrolase (TIGR01509 family)